MFLIKTLVLVVLANTIAGASVKKHRKVGIIGGHDIAIEDAPFMASIRTPDFDEPKNYTHMCGGTIIHERFILTAAHCIKHFKKFRVVVGTDKLNEGGVVYEVEQAISHENFTYSEGEWDVGLFKLNGSLTFSDKVQKITLTGGEKLVGGTSLQATGWGLRKHGSMNPSNELQQVEHPLIGSKLCNKIYGEYRNLTRTMICAGELGKSACNGDSGGPLTYQNTIQVGIASLTKRCAVFPVVYTKVAEMLPWIIETIDNNL